MDVDSLTKKMSLILELMFLGPIIKQPVFLSLTIEFNNIPNWLSVKSSKLFAIVNLVNGLYSSAVISNLLKENISFSIISSSILIFIILFDFSWLVISRPFIFCISTIG